MGIHHHRVKVVWIAVMLLFEGAASAQNIFLKTFGTADYEEVWGFALTSDQGFILGGYTGFGSACVIRLDGNGDTIWSKIIGSGGGFDLLYSIQQTPDSGFIAAGRTSGSGAGGMDILLIKLDTNGDVEWVKSIGGSGDETASSIFQTTDGGFILAGNTYSFGAGLNDFYIVKTDSSGNIVWSSVLGGTGNDNAYNVIETTDGGYAVVGLTVNSGNQNVLVAKLDALGGISWTKTYGGAGDDRGNCIRQTVDGGFIISGVTNSFGAGAYDFNLIKIDSAGFVSWAKAFGGGQDEWAYSVIQTADAGFAVAGYTKSFGAGGSDYFFVKTSNGGELIWAKAYGGQLEDYGISIQQTADSGYAFAGYAESFGAGSYDFFLVKTDTTGNSFCTQDISNVMVSAYTPITATSVLNVSTGGSDYILTVSVSSGIMIDTICQPVQPCSSTLELSYSITNATADGNDGAVKINVAGGTPPYSFSLDSIVFQSEGTFNDLDTGRYEVNVIDSNGCVTQGMFIVEGDSASGITMISLDGIRLFPNPFSISLTIELPWKNQVHVLVTDVFGIPVYSSDFHDTRIISLPLSQLSEGVYFLRVVQDTETYFEKVIKGTP